jgi:UDP-2,4-diacetamido-2,4,6-trideoxy-beta-L-altropyranose hydrolase
VPPAAIVFRTIAGKAIGFGHLRRCLTLAAELRPRTANVASIRFLLDGDPEAVALAEAAGFEARLVTGGEPAATRALLQGLDGAVLVVDSYELREDCFVAWRPAVRRLIAIDDLADRRLDADVIVNSSPGAGRLVYRAAADCRIFAGPTFALLRPSFRDLPGRAIGPDVARVLVTLGGTDPANSTPAVVSAVLRAVPGAAVEVVVGPLFGATPALDAIAAREADRLHVHRGLGDLKALMLAADLAVSAGGQTLFELAATGLPAAAICLAPNQQPNIDALADVTLLAAASADDAALGATVEEVCRRLARDPGLRRTLSAAGQRLVDGRGAIRVADAIVALVDDER